MREHVRIFIFYLRKEFVKETTEPGLFLKLIIWERILKGLLLLALAVGLVNSLHTDFGAVVNHLVRSANLDTDNRYIAMAIEKIAHVKQGQMLVVSIGVFLYSLLCLIEALGLHRRKRWAEYLTAFATAAFIPFEVYEIAKSVTFFRTGAFVLNIVIVIYLIRSKELFDGYREHALEHRQSLL